MKILEIVRESVEIKGKRIIVNEKQMILKDVQGFSVTLQDPDDPAIVTKMNLADKKIDTTGPEGMILVTDELSPAERANLIRGAKGSLIDIQVTSLT